MLDIGSQETAFSARSYPSTVLFSEGIDKKTTLRACIFT